MDGEADDVEIAAADTFDPEGGDALDGVGACLIEGLTGSEIEIDLLIGEGCEFHVGDLVVDGLSVCADESNTADDLVLPI